MNVHVRSLFTATTLAICPFFRLHHLAFYGTICSVGKVFSARRNLFVFGFRIIRLAEHNLASTPYTRVTAWHRCCFFFFSSSCCRSRTVTKWEKLENVHALLRLFTVFIGSFPTSLRSSSIYGEFFHAEHIFFSPSLRWTKSLLCSYF